MWQLLNLYCCSKCINEPVPTNARCRYPSIDCSFINTTKALTWINASRNLSALDIKNIPLVSYYSSVSLFKFLFSNMLINPFDFFASYTQWNSFRLTTLVLAFHSLTCCSIDIVIALSSSCCHQIIIFALCFHHPLRFIVALLIHHHHCVDVVVTSFVVVLLSVVNVLLSLNDHRRIVFESSHSLRRRVVDPSSSLHWCRRHVVCCRCVVGRHRPVIINSSSSRCSCLILITLSSRRRLVVNASSSSRCCQRCVDIVVTSSSLSLCFSKVVSDATGIIQRLLTFIHKIFEPTSYVPHISVAQPSTILNTNKPSQAHWKIHRTHSHRPNLL